MRRPVLSLQQGLLPLLLAAALALPLAACAQTTPAVAPPPVAAPVVLPQTNFYAITTPKGRIVVRLFDETPLHRDNFKRLVAAGTYDSTYFHRIIEGFVVQGGDPNTRDTVAVNDGEGDVGYTVPAEIGFPHLRGALAAARQGDDTNPQRASSGSQFYLVTGRIANDAWLDQALDRIRRSTPGDSAYAFPDDVREAYKARGGVPFLDRQYTVFGEVVEGLDVLMQFDTVETPRKRQAPLDPWIDRPYERLYITVRPLDGYTPPPSNR